MNKPVSRYPVPALDNLPDDVRQKILEVQEKAGFVPNVFLTFAHRPDEFRAFFAYHDALLLRESGLTKGEKEMIIVATSGANGCLYCVVAHGAILRIYEKNPLVADQVAVNYLKADITPRQKAMLDFAMKVCNASYAFGEARLRGAARARLQRRGRLGHRRHHRALRPVEPHGQRHLDAAERRVLPDGPRAEFDVNATEWPAVPDWWYAHVMGAIRRAFPDVVFFIACTGSLDDYPWLKEFDAFDLPTSFPYGYKGPSHMARRHPASDLFALACCNVIVGTPCSTFTHYAADMLGDPTTVLVPPATKMSRAEPSFCRLDLYGHGAFDYYAACRAGTGFVPVADAGELPVGLARTSTGCDANERGSPRHELHRRHPGPEPAPLHAAMRESLLAHGIAAESLLVIDNGSTDGTPAWLAARPEIRSVRNPVISAAAAPGRRARCSPTATGSLLNNDIVCAHDFVGAQLDAAERHGLQVVSPALVEFELDYDLAAFTAEFVAKMSGTVREGWFHGVCFSVRRTVFETLGFPDTDRLLFGREDAEFRARCLRHGLKIGTVGDALIHHFGSITQNAMKKEQRIAKFGDHRYFYAKLGLGWWGRQQAKFERKAQSARWVRDELARHGMTLHMVHRDGHVEYR